MSRQSFITADDTNTEKNMSAYNSIGGGAMHVLTKMPDNIIYDFNAMNSVPSKREKRDSWLVDTDKYNAAQTAKANGEMDKYAGLIDASRSKLYKELIKTASQQDEQLDGLYIPPAQVLLGKTISAAGQILQTAQEIVRQTKYQTKVTGVHYRMEIFQGMNAARRMPSEDLTIKSALDAQLPVGHREIGDDMTPEITRPEFTTVEKQIFADSFHYGFGMRERSDQFINMEEIMTSKVPGVMAKMKNDKVVELLNSTTDTTEYDLPAGKLWDAYGANAIVMTDAGVTIDILRQKIEEFRGDLILVAPHEVIRAYQRNVQGRNVVSPNTLMPPSARTGKLEFEGDVTYFEENTMSPKTAVLLAKDAWVYHHIGPEVDVAYKDDRKPSAMEMRLLFHFNGVQRMFSSAAQRFTAIA